MRYAYRSGAAAVMDEQRCFHWRPLNNSLQFRFGLHLSLSVSRPLFFAKVVTDELFEIGVPYIAVSKTNKKSCNYSHLSPNMKTYVNESHYCHV